MIKSKKLAEALFELAEEKTPDLEAKFFDFIKKRNLEGELSSILYHLEKIIEKDKEKKGVVIETAHEISDQIVHNIKKHLKIEDLPEVKRVNKELVGGFRARWKGMIYDSSISSGLKKLEKEIIS